MTLRQAARSAVTVTACGPVTEIVVGTGTRRNALGTAGWADLARCVEDAGQTDDVRVIVISGRGDTFCAGSDMSEWVGAEPDRVESSFAAMESAFRAVEACPVPVIAAVRGTAAGAGCQLALACDLRILTLDARIGMPITRLGILCSPAFAARLVTLAGPSVARRLLYTGALFDGAASVEAGLADICVPDPDLDARLDELLSDIARQPRTAVTAAKRAVATALTPTTAATARPHGPAVAWDDFQRGIGRFLDARGLHPAD